MRLEPLGSEEALLVWEWLQDPSVSSHIVTEQPCLEKPFFLLGVRLEDGTLIGWVSIFHVDLKNGKAEVGGGARKGNMRGLSLRVLRQVSEFAFEGLGLNRLEFRVIATNRVATGLMRKFAVFEGMERQAHKSEEGYIDILRFSLLKSEWR